MNRSFYNGVSGIKTHQFGIDTWANNIANENTYGFKENLPEFENSFSQILSTTDFSPTMDDVGLGSNVQRTSLDLKHGEWINSENGFDTAISGDGWYGFKGEEFNYYTKLGAFKIDDNGDLVNAAGQYLLGTENTSIKPAQLSEAKLKEFGKEYTSEGLKDPTIYTLDLSGDTPLDSVDKQGKIHLPTFLYLPPVPTQNITFGGNLNIEVESQIDETTGEEVAKSSDHFTTSIINSDGSKNILDMTFTREFPGPTIGTSWQTNFKVLKDVGVKQEGISYDPNQYVTYPNNDTLYQIIDSKDGSLTFNGTGALTSANIPQLSNDGVSINVNLGTPLDPNISNSGYDGMTAIKGLGHEAKTVKNDGKEEGIFTDYKITSDGNIIANFSNGDSGSVAKIAIFHFRNDGGLQKISGTMLKSTPDSGKATFYTKDGVAINGSSIITHRLENSNVHLSTAMTELIIMQKAFDANAKSITTSDQMIQKAINMKR